MTGHIDPTTEDFAIQMPKLVRLKPGPCVAVVAATIRDPVCREADKQRRPEWWMRQICTRPLPSGSSGR